MKCPRHMKFLDHVKEDLTDFVPVPPRSCSCPHKCINVWYFLMELTAEAKTCIRVERRHGNRENKRIEGISEEGKEEEEEREGE